MRDEAGVVGAGVAGVTGAVGGAGVVGVDKEGLDGGGTNLSLPMEAAGELAALRSHQHRHTNKQTNKTQNTEKSHTNKQTNTNKQTKPQKSMKREQNLILQVQCAPSSFTQHFVVFHQLKHKNGGVQQ